MATYEIKAPDGNSYRIDGPDGASDDQVREQVLKQHPNADTPAAPKETSTVGDVLKEGGKGLLRGAASFAGDIGEAVMGPFGPSKHFANLKADFGLGERPQPEPTYGAQISKAAGIEPSPQTTAGKYVGATGEVLGNPATYLGPGSLALKAGAGAAGALASEGAGQLAQGAGMEGLEPVARVAGGLVGGAGTATIAAERNLSKLAAQLPTPKNIYDAANAGYDMLKKSNTRISPQGTADLLNTVKTDLHADHFRDYLAPATYRAIEELAVNGAATVGDLDGVRRVLNRISPTANPTDKEAANRAIRAIDDYLINVDPAHIISGDPARDAAILKHAQGNWALHKQLELLDDASIKGQHRAGVSGSGANRINTARQEVRKILDSDKKSRGMSDAVKEKMEEIVMGTWLTNRARQIGKFSPSGPVSATTSILTGLGAGAPAGAAVAGGGFLAKHLGEYLTDRQIKQLEQLMRSESPIGKPIARAIAPDVEEQSAVPAASVARSVLTSPLGNDSALSK